MIVDGANLASVFDNSSVTDINTTNRPADPAFVEIFKDMYFSADVQTLQS